MPSLNWSRVTARQLAEQPELQSAWNGLNAAHGQLPFLDASVIAHALAVFGTGQEVLVQGRDADGRVQAMGVLQPAGRWRWQTFQPSQVPLGAWVSAPDVAAHAACDSLLRSGALGWAMTVSLTQLDERLHPRQDGSHVQTFDYIRTAWVDVTGSFADYWAARGKNLRQNMRKQRNKLTADGINTQLRVLREPEAMADALVRYGAMESAGWKAQEGTSIHPDNAQGRFYLGLLTDAARRGEACVHEYLFDDRVVASNLCLKRRGVLIVLKTTYAEDVGKSLSPASLLREDEMQLLFDSGEIHRIEYFGKVMEWHTKLTEQQRAVYHLTAYRWQWLKRLAERRRAASANEAASAPGTAGAAGAPADAAAAQATAA